MTGVRPKLSTLTKILIYFTCMLPVLLFGSGTRTLLIHIPIGKDWTPFICSGKDASYTSVGMTSFPVTKFFAVPACLKSHSLFTNEDSVFSATLPDSLTPYRTTSRSHRRQRIWVVTRHLKLRDSVRTLRSTTTTRLSEPFASRLQHLPSVHSVVLLRATATLNSLPRTVSVNDSL